MAGLDKIINQIAEEAEHSANQIIEEAKKEALRIWETEEEQTKKICLAMEEDLNTEIVNYREQVKSSADFQRRTFLLRAKQEIIENIMEKAYRTLENESIDVYFDFIAKLICKYAQGKSGRIYFSQKDLSRMPEGFEEKIEQAAAVNDGTLTLMKETRDIQNGFILVYGGIEENCTLQAVFNARKEEIQDKVYGMLFS